MRRRSSAGAAATLIAACVFGAALLLSLVSGAGLYRQVQSRVDAAASDRVGLTYITAKIHGRDAAGAVRSGSFGGEDAVFLLQDMGGTYYETILYVYDGWLMELFCEQGWELEPADGQKINEAQALSVTEEQGMLRLHYTDDSGRRQSADIFLRSDKG